MNFWLWYGGLCEYSEALSSSVKEPRRLMQGHSRLRAIFLTRGSSPFSDLIKPLNHLQVPCSSLAEGNRAASIYNRVCAGHLWYPAIDSLRMIEVVFTIDRVLGFIIIRCTQALEFG